MEDKPIAEDNPKEVTVTVSVLSNTTNLTHMLAVQNSFAQIINNEHNESVAIIRKLAECCGGTH